MWGYGKNKLATPTHNFKFAPEVEVTAMHTQLQFVVDVIW